MLAEIGSLPIRVIKAVVTMIIVFVVVIVTRAPGTSWKEQLRRSLFGGKDCPNCGTRMAASEAACPNCRFPQP